MSLQMKVWLIFFLSHFLTLFPSRHLDCFFHCISASQLLLIFSKTAWHVWNPLKPEERQSKTQWMDFKKRWERDWRASMRQRGSTHCFVFFHLTMSVRSYDHHWSFSGPKLAANMCRTASSAANGSMDETELPPPLRKRGKKEFNSTDYTLYTSGDVGQEDRSFFEKSSHSAGAEEHLWKTTLGTIK